jgi:hypothetical protein
MVHHPIVLGAKVLLLLVILIVLVILHGVLPPEHFTTAVYIAAAVFLVGVVGLWVFAGKVLGNPDSRLGRHFILPESPAADAAAAGERDGDLVSQRGVVLSPLHPAGTARIGDRRESVVTDGEFVDPGTEVEVVAQNGARIVVRPVASGGQEEA